MKKLIFLSIYLASLFSFSQKKLYVDNISDFQNGYAIVKKGNITTFIDTTGTELKIDSINLIHDEYGMKKNGFFINTEEKGITLKGKEGIKNISGEYVVKPKYRITTLNGYYIVEEKDFVMDEPTFNILDENCKSIFKISGYFSNKMPIIPLTNNIIAISNDEGYPSYNYKLIFIAENKETDYVYGDFGKNKNGLIKAYKFIKNEGKFKWGFLDKKGNKVIDFIYSNPPGDFGNNLAVVKNLDGKFGYINNKNEVVIEPTFNVAYGFINNKAIVRVHNFKSEGDGYNEGYRLINTKGVIIYDLKDFKPNFTPYDYYKKTIIEKNNIIILKKYRSKFIFILNLNNLELIQTKFSGMNQLNSGLSLVSFYDSENNLKYGYANEKGELVFIKSKREF